MHHLYLTSRAEVDAQKLWDYLALNSVESADRFIDRLTEVFGHLASYPSSVEEIRHRSRTFRRLPVAPYVVYYTLTAGDVCVVRILHASRRWEDLL